MKLPIALVLLALALPCPAASQTTPTRVEVPIHETVLSNGAHRYSIPVQLGQVSIEAGLDTGATGIRILSTALSAKDMTDTGKATTTAFAVGTQMDGPIVETQLSIGALSNTVTAELVKKISCVPTIPNCLASRIPFEDYHMLGAGLRGEGFKAMIGANLGEADVARPFRALGARRWIIELPLPGGGKPGRLILNPTTEEMAGYRRFQLMATFRHWPGGMHDAIPGCIANAVTEEKLCAPVLFDTAATGVSILNSPATPLWPDGAPATLTLLEGPTDASVSFTIKAGDPLYGMAKGVSPNPLRPHIQPGALPYFGFSVLYDSWTNTIGLKPRTDAELSVK